MKNENIPNGWEKTSIGSLIIEEPKSKIQVGEVANFGEYPFFTSGDDILKHTEYLVDGEKIYMATGGCANVKYFNKKASYSTDTYVISTNKKLNTKYLYYEIDRLNYYINANYFLGSGLKHLQKKDFKKHEIVFPASIKEQNTIISLLTKIDIAIEQTKSLMDKYSNIKKGLMHDLFAYGIDEKGQIRSEKTHNFKDSSLGRIPIEWEVVELGKVSKIQRGKFGHRPRNDPDYYNGQFPFVQTGDVTNSDFYLKEYSQTLSKLGTTASRLFPVGTIIMTIAANIGDVAINQYEVYFPDSLVGINADETRVNTEFLYYRLITKKDELNSIATESAQKNINYSNLVPLKIAIPVEIKEQIKIKDKLMLVDEQIRKEQKTMENLQAQKQGLMSDLLTGKVRVKEE